MAAIGYPPGMKGYSPMKAVLVDQPFSDRDWIFERKLDGIRCGAVRRRGRVQLVSRSGEALDRSYPELVAQIAFTEWTRDGKMRHSRYQGLRADKPASEVVRERPS